MSIICLMMSVLLPSLNRARETANRVKCASNLRQIGQALLLYSNENRGAYPRTFYSSGANLIADATGSTSADPFATTNPVGTNNIPAALFLLMRTQEITSEVFTCPSSSGEKDDYGGGSNSSLNRGNFSAIPKNLSFSFADPYPNSTAVGAGYKWNSGLDPAFAVAADMNPGITGSNDAVTNAALTTTASQANLKQGNSNNHNEDGQNVLFGDGHAEFVNTCRSGVNKDNIYTYRTTTTDDIGSLANTGSPVDGNDSYLLPTDDNCGF
jgi:prepilin-type processing-associated H-X9-DG protein